MVTSAGLLLFRRTSGLEVLLAHMGGPYWAGKDERAWTIPKGIAEDGEDHFAAALREFREEIGSLPEVADHLDLGTVKQSNKHVHIWAAEGDLDVSSVHSNTFELEWPPRSGQLQPFPEVDRAEWFPPADARTKIVSSQVPFLDRLEAALNG